MRNTPRLAALLSILLAAAPASAAGRAAVPRVGTLTPSLYPGMGAPGLIAGPGAGLSAAASLNPHGLAASLAPSIPAALLSAPALSPSAPLAVAAADASQAASGLSALDSLRALAAPADGPRWVGGFDGGRGRGAAPETDYVVNDEGVRIHDRAAVYYTEVRRMVDEYKGKLDLQESLDVMDDAYGDVLAKISAVEAVAKGRGLSRENTHLEETLVWVDGVLSDGDKKVAVHTHRVFFHRSHNPKSEIAEGIRRVSGYLDEAEKMFAQGGKAERQLGRLDEVELVFDARGYKEIKEHIRARGEVMARRTGGRVTVRFLDDLAPLPQEQKDIRAKLNELAQVYNGEGMSKIYEGVIYSRYVGLLLELKTVEHYHKLGYKILQSGRELLDKDGMYITELDVVVQSPQGKVLLVEAKSARVGLPQEEVLNDKVVYKLRTYQKYRAELEAMIGHKIEAVVFSMDVAIDPDIDPAEVLPKDLRKIELMDYLRAQEQGLSRRFGFPTSFLFLQSGPKLAAPGSRDRRLARPDGGKGSKHGKHAGRRR